MPQTPPAQKTSGQPFLKGSVIWQKKGPLPVWAWLIISLAAIFVVVWWRRNLAAAQATQSTTGYTDELPGNQSAPPIFIVPQAATPAVNITVPAAPVPGRPPTNDPGTVPTAPPGGGAPPPTAPPAPVQIPLTESVPIGTSIYDWIDGLNQRYPGLKLDLNKLRAYNNNDIDKYISWNPGPPGTNYKTPVFNRNWSGRNPPLGIPALRIREF